MEFFVYILYSSKYDRYYKGQTSSLARRFHRHQNGKEKYTAPGRPWKLIWYTTKFTRTEAKELEIKLKNMSVKKLERFMVRYPSMPISKVVYGH
ncbi:MAG: GIY-YIG nuclease family protein [Flavobacteriaceae bacterium]